MIIIEPISNDANVHKLVIENWKKARITIVAENVSDIGNGWKSDFIFKLCCHFESIEKYKKIHAIIVIGTKIAL